ncbi:unnamed protein product [Blepharisma stoltei]|uniref:Arf-GAP domain-containing protein n=1 Tax=Blepharisma stoltei TaxID=1481888 RepID=A0AAU9JM22_9CILI|nr:unnamed protein product [Blepharisma stoltei]
MEAGLAFEVFEALMADDSNKACVDCNSPNPDHGSVNHGVFICNQCAVSHLELKGASKVKSLRDEPWNPEELKLMIAGGNAALRDYFMYYGFTNETPINLKYRTRSATFYRDMLEIISKEVNCESNFMPLEDGILLAQDEQTKLYAHPRPSILATKENSKEEVVSSQPEKGFKGWIVRTFNKTREAGNRAFKRINDFGNTPKMRNLESKSLGLVNKVKHTFRPITADSSKIEFMDKYSSNIAVRAVHTFENINLSPESQKIKREAMNLMNCNSESSLNPAKEAALAEVYIEENTENH